MLSTMTNSAFPEAVSGTATAVKGNILLVDDTPDNLRLLSSILTDQGYKVRSVIRGSMALTAAQTSPPELILLDITMPEMNGYEVCERLKGDPRTADIPVIFISALDDVLDKVRAFQSGGVDYISKPFQLEEVLARVQTHITLSRQQRALHEQKREIETLGHLKDQLLSTVSHDLKSPLTVILGLSRILQATLSGLPPEQVQDMLGKIHHSAEKMVQLITDLLDLSRIEQGMQLQLQRIDLAALLGQQMHHFEFSAQQKQIPLSLSLPDETLSVRADPQRLEQVLSNLLSNAIKYTPNQGTVQVQVVLEPTLIHVQVRDTGFGIPAADVAHVFDRFYRVNHPQHRQETGTGLGLAIAKSIMEQHGGDLQVSSELGVGSVFTMVLPRC
ncbi:MAG: hybrid sensor histidine kinase/response regulator [Synechococcales cyanobacterium]